MELENFKGDFLGITDNGNPDVEVFLANGQKEDIYSNFRMFGIGKQSDLEKSWEEKRRIAKEERHQHSWKQRAENIAMKVPMAPVRAGFLAGLRLNIFGLSRKLYPAILSEEDAKKKNYDLENRKVALDKLRKIEDLYFKIGGRSESIEKNIRVGFDRPIFNTKKIKKQSAAHKSSFDGETDTYSQVVGYDDAAEVASGMAPLGAASSIAGGLAGAGGAAGAAAGGLSAGTIAAIASAGAGAVGSIASAVSKKKAADNPYKEGSDEWKRAQDDIDKAKAGGYHDSPIVTEADIDKLIAEKGKILGMKPFVFYGIAAAAIIGLGILVVKSSKK